MAQHRYKKEPFRTRTSQAGEKAYNPWEARAAGRRMREIARQKKARNALTAVFGIMAALVITALLAMPHLMQEPQEVAAEPEAIPVSTPQPEPIFTQLSDPRLVLVNEEIPIPEDYRISPRTYDSVEVNALLFTDLCALLDAAWAEDCVLWLASGYRSVENQSTILEQAVENRMKNGMSREEAYNDARLTIQAPGFSEHHTGLAIDFNEVNYAFEDTDAYAWLAAHAAEYGFVQRYPADKVQVTGIDYEPWHYRYVGREHAKAMQELHMCLEEYVEHLKSDGVN